MTFNPVILLVLALASIALGTALLSQTGSWLGMIPFIAFVLLFFISLFQPERT